MRKVIPFLSSVAIMTMLTLRQRLFVVQSDRGKQWAVMAMWFGLCNWFTDAPGSRAPTRNYNGSAIARRTIRRRTQRGSGNPSRVGDSDAGPRSLVYTD